MFSADYLRGYGQHFIQLQEYALYCVQKQIYLRLHLFKVIGPLLDYSVSHNHHNELCV